jgi:uncharacterized protein YjbJ (UPF0337 family)
MGEILDRLKGRAKQIYGSMFGDRSKQAEGFVEEKKGEAKGVVEDLKHEIKHPPR